MKKLGLISGSGELPFAVATEARSKGYHVTVLGLESLASPELSSYADEVHWVNVGNLGRMISLLKGAGIKEAIFAGKVHKSIIYKGAVMPDLPMIRIFLGLKNRSDDAIMLAIVREFEKEGITMRNTTDFTEALMTPEGVLTRRKPSAGDYRDIEFGWKIAKEIGRLDIGQTIVVKKQAVMAVEAIEGTDEAIRRGGQLAGKGAVVIKISKPQQDLRFDVPVVGLETLRSMTSVKAGVLAIEAQKSILLDRRAFIDEAERSGIAVIGYLQR
ncbi:MAG: LpxI family protein [Nitrospirae bacterium]|nr:LpxI family protein [Nitrospirota bacterium]